MDMRARLNVARVLAVVGLVAGLLALPGPAVGAAAAPRVTVIARGLDNPRGIAFGPEGALYVAEAGRGGAGPCTSFELFGAPLCFGPSGAVTRVRRGHQQRVATGFGSFAHSDGDFAWGPHDISFQGRSGAYVTVGGCFPVTPAQTNCGVLFRLSPNGERRLVADLNAYELRNNPDGAHPGESNPYGVLALPGERIVSDAAGNDLLRVGPDGQISTLAVFPERLVPAPPFLGLPPGTQLPMDAVPTGLALGRDGALYVGELTGFPFPVGAARVYRVAPGHAPQVFAEGFTNVIDIAFDHDGGLLVLEIAKNSLLSNDRTGALIRVDRNGSRQTLLSEGLINPTAIAVRGEAVYLSNCGTCAGAGQVIRISFGDNADHGDDD